MANPMLEQTRVEWTHFKKKAKSLRHKRRLSFITVHYLYLIGWTIVGSILIYPAGVTPYIDALFFASGSATQSGLNTIDVNKLHTYQQVVIYLIAMVCNPIAINTFLVFVRLYWFEKRFQHIVDEARNLRSTRTRSQTRSMARHERDEELAERGVNGREITILRDQGRVLGPPPGIEEKVAGSDVITSGSSSSSEAAKREANRIAIDNDNGSYNKPLHSPRAINFVDDVQEPASSGSTTDQHPADQDECHIAFVQAQKYQNDKALRIPGPREADEGAVPEEVEGGDNDADANEEKDQIPGILRTRTESQSLPMRPNVTIEEPPRPMHSTTSQSRGPHRMVPGNPYALGMSAKPGDPTHNQPTKRPRSTSMSSMGRSNTRDRIQGTVSYLSWQPAIGRNSMFFDLTEEQREELGGIEYRSLKTLAVILVVYFLFWHVLGAVVLVPWILRSPTFGAVIDNDGQSRAWWAIFSAATFFNDLGFTLTPDSFISFNESVLTMLLGSFLIVIGNTGFPCMLRFIIWLESKLIPITSPLYEEIRFLLDHPRRCFTLLFPSTATWILFGILVLLNGIDLVFFVLLDLKDQVVVSLPPAFKFLDGLFQAFSTRTAGTECVNLAELHPGIQVSYLIMMYISVFPIAISVRRTNVYEERSLGVYSSQADDAEDEAEPSYVGAHLRRQLSFDLWFIFMGLFIVAIAEGNRIADPNDPAFTLFACLFEIVSAYGTVGLSLGYPDINASFSAEFTVISKLVIIAMQIRGRHRGLPYELDRAILLPSESLHREEDKDAERRGLRRLSTVNVADTEDAQHLGVLERITARHPTQASHATHASGRESERDAASMRSGWGSGIHRPPPARQSLGKFMAGLAKPMPHVPLKEG